MVTASTNDAPVSHQYGCLSRRRPIQFQVTPEDHPDGQACSLRRHPLRLRRLTADQDRGFRGILRPRPLTCRPWETTVVAKDGETGVIGGLIRHGRYRHVRGFPARRSRKRNLLVFVHTAISSPLNRRKWNLLGKGIPGRSSCVPMAANPPVAHNFFVIVFAFRRNSLTKRQGFHPDCATVGATIEITVASPSCFFPVLIWPSLGSNSAQDSANIVKLNATTLRCPSAFYH